MRVAPGDFEQVFGRLSPHVTQRVIDYKFEHQRVTPQVYDEAILDMIQAVYHNELPVSGPARHPIWEKGWAENLATFDPAKAGRMLAMPHYYNKHNIFRWQGELVTAISENYEHNMLAIIQDWAFDRYLRRMDTVMEFGCGTGHNLFRVRDVNQNAMLIGLDWAESAVKFIDLQAQAGAYEPGPAFSARFNFFEPTLMQLSPNTAFVTVAALEQVGVNWKPFYDFIMESKPKIVIHIEPIEEVLDHDVLLDHLSLEYFRKRGYLSGWLRHLIMAHELNRVTILDVKRTRIGSKFIEGYTVVVWTPTSGATRTPLPPILAQRHDHLTNVEACGSECDTPGSTP